MKKILNFIIASLLVTVSLSALTSEPAGAIKVFEEACQGGTESAVCEAQGTDKLLGPGSFLTNVINFLLFIIGIIAVIMIIIGGMRYVLSGGDSAGVTNAKNTIIYAVIGLVVAMLAYALVNFVLARI